jgi:hypothetical protein
MVGSGIRKKPIPDPGLGGQKGTGSRIQIRNTDSFHSKAKKHRFCLYIRVGEFCPVILAISACIYIVLTAMKRGNEALNASSLQFLGIVKRFIATISSQR